MASLARSPDSRSTLRRSLGACTAEGAAAEVVGACCGGAALTGWALHLGMSAKLIGLVGALPVVAQVLQMLGAVLTARFGYRRTALVAVAVSRQTFLPLVVLPWLPLGSEGRRTLLLVVAGAHHGLGIVANNAWNTWMGELIPARLRGRYFGRRTAICTVAGGLFALGAGAALDGGQRAGAAGAVLQALAMAASCAGALSVVLMARQGSHPHRREAICVAWSAMRAPLADPEARGIVVYSIAWNAACGLSAPFFGLYLLSELRAGYAAYAATGVGYALARTVSASAFGRAVDRIGSRRVLLACTAGLALSPLAWVGCAPGRLWPLAVETVLGGLLLGGHGVASFALPLSVGPERQRPFYLAVVAVGGGAAFALTSAIGGAVADVGGSGQTSLRSLFVGSLALRGVAVVAAARLREHHHTGAPSKALGVRNEERCAA